MKVSYIQVFDDKDEANVALAYALQRFPNHDNSLVSNSTQVQVLGRISNQKFGRAFGSLDDENVYLVISLAE